MDMRHPFHIFPIHLYHATLPPIVANDAGTEAEARAKGYGDEYIPQEYPKMVHQEVADLAAQVAAGKDGYAYSGGRDDPFPRTVSKTLLGPPVEPEPAAAPVEVAPV